MSPLNKKAKTKFTLLSFLFIISDPFNHGNDFPNRGTNFGYEGSDRARRSVRRSGMADAQMRDSYSEDCPASWPDKFPDCANVPVASLENIPYSPANTEAAYQTGPRGSKDLNQSSTTPFSTSASDKEKYNYASNKYSIQSPIDIRVAETILTEGGGTNASATSALFFRNYDLASRDWRLEKTKATVMLKTDTILPFIEIPEAYEFRQAHFHWGPGGGTQVGSEHSIDGKYYSLEAHIVHESKVKPNSYAVVGIFYDVPIVPTEYNFRTEVNGGRAHEFYRKIWGEGHNDQLDPLIAALRSEQNEGYELGPGYNATGGSPIVKMINVSASAKPFTLYSLFPEGWDGTFYRYQGSLTTPPCLPTVTWFVIKTVGTLSREQLSVFDNVKQCEIVAMKTDRQAKDRSEGIQGGKCYADKPVGPNRRPTQSTNYRPVYYVVPSSSGAMDIIPQTLRQPLKELSVMFLCTYIFLKFLHYLE